MLLFRELKPHGVLLKSFCQGWRHCRALPPRHVVGGSVWTPGLQPPLFQGEIAGKPLEIQDDGAAVSYLPLVGCVSPGRAEASPWDVSPSPGTIPPLSPFLPILPSSSSPGEPIHVHPSSVVLLQLGSAHRGGLKSHYIGDVGYHPQTLCLCFMDQTAAGGSLQPVISWGGMWHVPSQGHAWHMAFPTWARR